MSPSSLAVPQILRTKVFPWAHDVLNDRLLICGRDMPHQKAGSGFEITPCRVKGPRVANRNGLQYDRKRWVIARWPADALNEVVQPRLVYVLSGRMRFQVNNYLIECEAGHALLIPSGIPHSNASQTCAVGETPHCELLYLLPFPNSIQCWMDRFSTTSNEIEPIGNVLLVGERLSTTYRVLVEEILEQGETSVAASGLMHAFWAQVQRRVEAGDFLPINHTENNYMPSSTADRFKTNDFMATLNGYVYAHIHKTITIDDMTRLTLQSRSQFTRRVLRETGRTFVEYLTDCRVEEAKRMLTETQWGIAVIAQSVGINPSYFSTVFSQRTGLTPSAYREQHWK